MNKTVKEANEEQLKKMMDHNDFVKKSIDTILS